MARTAARATIDEYLARFGRERGVTIAPLSADGTTTVQRGSAVVSVHVVDDKGVLLLLAQVLKVPAARREALYRTLLEASWLATADAAFAIDQASDTVYLRCLRRLDGLDYDELEDLLHTIATTADEWDDRLQREFG